MFYSDTLKRKGLLMLYLSTILHCKCIFLALLFVILNITTIFEVWYYNTHLKFATMNTQRRKRISKLVEQLEELKSELETIMNEEAFDNLPESFQELA